MVVGYFTGTAAPAGVFKKRFKRQESRINVGIR